MGCSQSKSISPSSPRAQGQTSCDLTTTSSTTTAAQAATSACPIAASPSNTDVRQDSSVLLSVIPSTPSPRTFPGDLTPRGGGEDDDCRSDEAPSPRLAAVTEGATILLSPRDAASPPSPLPQIATTSSVQIAHKKRTLPAPFNGKIWLASPSSAPLTLGSGPRRPATNPTPTSHHDVLLNVYSPLTHSQEIAAMSSTTGGDGSGGGSGISARGGRRPRPLAISTDSHFHLSTILGHVLIGGDEVSDNLTVLRQLNVKSVVNATTEGKETLGDLCYIKLNWSDDITQPILPDLPRAFATIDLAKDEGGVCLVHCKKGMSRSGAVVVAYLMFHNPKMSLLDALTYARSRRAIVAPNLGFMAQLIEWEREHRGGRVTVDLAKYEENRFGDTAVLLCGA